MPRWLAVLALLVVIGGAAYGYPIYRDNQIRHKIEQAYNLCEDYDTDEELASCTAAQERLFQRAKSACFHGDSYNCQDFSSHRDAQDLYKLCEVVTGRDVHRLDGDGDGQACESLH